VLDVLCEEDKALAGRIVEGLRLLEDDALGGGGGRGSGRVRFSSLSLTWRGKDYYARNAAGESLVENGNLSGLQELVTGDGFAAKLA
jgi:CRISPR-associated protein Csm3